MKLLARAFVYGVGFVAGAATAGLLLGYGGGKLAEREIRRLSKPMDYECPGCDFQTDNTLAALAHKRLDQHGASDD